MMIHQITKTNYYFMKYFNIYLLLPFFIFLASCSKYKNENKRTERSNRDTIAYIQDSDSAKYQLLILQKGDPDAYMALSSIYKIDLIRILPYALIMAEKYNYEDYMTVSEGILDLLRENKDMDPKKREIWIQWALYYMVKVFNNEELRPFVRGTLIEMYSTGEFTEKNEALVKYIRDGGTDIDGFLDKQKAQKNKK